MAATAKKYKLFINKTHTIVLGEENSNVRNQEVMSLLDYGFNHYQMDLIKSKDEVLKTLPLDKATKSSISFVPVSDIGVLTEKSNSKKNYTYSVKIKKFNLPVKKGDVLGSVIVKDKDKQVATVPLTSSESISQLSFLQLLGKSISDLVSGNFTFSFE